MPSVCWMSCTQVSKDAFGIQKKKNLNVSFLSLTLVIMVRINWKLQNAMNFAQKFARKIIGNVTQSAFQSANHVMEVVCQSLPLNATVLVSLQTSPVIALAMTSLRSVAMDNAFIPYMKKKRLLEVDVKVR